jgi:hypothetical protein
MKDETQMVTGNPGGVEEPQSPSTPAGGVEPKGATPTSTPADADKGTASVQQQYEEQIAKLNRDLNQMKSTFQRSEAERERTWKQREQEYQRQLEELRVSGMDEEQRKAYEATSVSRRLQETEQRLSQVEAERQEAIALTQATNYFLSLKVPLTELNQEEGYDALWESGMRYLTQELSSLRESQNSQPPTSSKPVEAPAVVTSNNAPSYSGTTWKALIQEYGDEETVYRLVESGQLPPSIIPASGKS